MNTTRRKADEYYSSLLPFISRKGTHIHTFTHSHFLLFLPNVFLSSSTTMPCHGTNSTVSIRTPHIIIPYRTLPFRNVYKNVHTRKQQLVHTCLKEKKKRKSNKNNLLTTLTNVESRARFSHTHSGLGQINAHNSYRQISLVSPSSISSPRHRIF